jgi:dTDP-4-dehydrorhamnose reductase
MLGHRLWMALRQQHETWVTIRGDASQFPVSPEFPKSHVRPNVDAQIFDEVMRAFASIQPDLAINCIGLVKQTAWASDPLASIHLNALFPHRVSLICRIANIRMIHISTDCVFSGKKGHYDESDHSDAEDLYGRTKFLGEVSYLHTITLRTSIIGQELKNHLGLVDWFLSQTGTIKGFQRAIYTGFTTMELARIIMNYVIPHPEMNGVYHISSDPISKYDLLSLVKAAYGSDVKITPDQDFVSDRSLNSQRFRQETGYIPPTWPEMISEMAAQVPFYRQFQG